MPRSFVFGLVATAALLPATLLAQEQDTVFPLTGVPVKGTVTAMTKSKVTIDAGGVARDFAVNAIRRVTFATDPAELRRARDAVAAGRYEDTKDDLGKVDAASLTQNVVKQDVAYYLAYATAKLALGGAGDREAAHTALLAFVGANPDSFHYFEAAELLGDLAIARSQFADAQKYYGALELAEWPEYKLRAAILQAKALVLQKKYPEALKMYENVINSPLSTPEVNREKQFAEIGRAVCLADTGEVDQAKTIVLNIIQKNDAKDLALFGRAYNALGACHERSGELKLALQDYLHTDLLFYTEPEVHAEALYHLGKLWNTAAKNSDRALKAQQLLKSRYAGTAWARLE